MKEQGIGEGAALAHRLTASPFVTVEASPRLVMSAASRRGRVYRFRPGRRADRGGEPSNCSICVYLPLSFPAALSSIPDYSLNPSRFLARSACFLSSMIFVYVVSINPIEKERLYPFT